MHTPRTVLPLSRRRGIMPAILVVSGIAGLGYQVVWTRMLSVGLGHEAVAMLSVIAAFLVGLAIGGALADRAAPRTKRPGLWYAALELVAGAWSLVLIGAIPSANELFIGWLDVDPSGPRWLSVCFFGPLLLLAPATIAMGATLPFAERLHARISQGCRDVGLLYGANAGGAAIGAVLTLAVLSPRFGFDGTLMAFAGLNLLCAILTVAGPARIEWRGRGAAGMAETLAGRLHHRIDPALIALLASTGLLGIGLEVAVTRALGQTLENTVYSFAAMIATYLVGAALGSTLGARAWPSRTVPGLLTALAVAAGWSATCIPASGFLYRSLLGAGLPGLAAEWLVTGVLFLPASVLMGALFADLAQKAARPDGGLGAALAANLVGAALAPAIIGVGLLPRLGAMQTTLCLALAYLALSLALSLSRRRMLAAVGLTASAAAAALLLPASMVVHLPDERIVAHREDVLSTATVLENAAGARRLVVDGRFAMGGDTTEGVDRLQGHIPLLLHPHPKRALFLGLGSGATFAAAAAYPDLTADAVELSPAVLEILPWFRRPAADIARQGLTLHTADARRFVRAGTSLYDVIVADTFHPARDGTGLLYTVEHFRAVRDRLAEGGLFAQWLPLHQFDLPTLKIVTRSFLEVFPDATLQLANASLATPLVALVGWRDAAPPSVAELSARVTDPDLARRLARLGIDSPEALLGGLVAGPKALREFAGGAPINTDAFPHVIFAAPASVYAPLAPPMDRLEVLLELERRPGDVVAIGPRRSDTAFADRLARYWQARDSFLRLGQDATLTGDPHVDAEALASPLLDILAISPSYTPALKPLEALATALHRSDPAMALALRRAVSRRVADALTPAAFAGSEVAR